MPLVVRLRSAVTVLGRFPALAGVDLDVERGETVLLSGPNGAGKTTLLRVLAGLVPLTTGEGSVLGHDLRTERRAVRRELALVGHEPAAYDDLTADENLRFALRAAGRADPPPGAVARLGLDAFANVRAGRLSAGQRRRLALGLALVRQPRLLLLDEPHAGLDDGARAALDGIIRDWTAVGCTVVLASHEQERARPLASREVALANGRVQAISKAATPV